MLDEAKAIWLAELIAEATLQIEHDPGLIIEVEDKPETWIQAFPQTNADGEHSGFALNFPYRETDSEPVGALRALGVHLPPDSRTLEWEANGFASIFVRPDVPFVALARLISDILEKAVGAPSNPDLSVQIEYGF